MQKCTPLPKAMWRLGLRPTSNTSGSLEMVRVAIGGAQELDDDLVLLQSLAAELASPR